MASTCRSRYVWLSLLVSLLLHLLATWLYQDWQADQVPDNLQPVRFDQAPSTNTERFEARPRTVVPKAVMEQLRLAELMQLPSQDLSTPSPTIATEAVTPDSPADLTDEMRPEFRPGDTLGYRSTLQDLYRTGNLELGDGRLLVLPLADMDSEVGQRRHRAEQIIARALEAMGGLERLQAIRDKKVRREVWDSTRNTWIPAGMRYFRRGLQYLEVYERDDGSRTQARGFDGRQSWYIRFGLHLPPRDERYTADRWDFLTRFRGDGVIAEYVGRRQVQHKSLEAVRVIDTKYGRQRLAYFDVREGLLDSETEAGTTTHYVEYRRTGNVLTPFEIRVARSCYGCIEKYRWHTDVNVDLAPGLFIKPPSATWDPQVVHKTLFEHAEIPVDGPTSLKLHVESLTISINPGTGLPYMNRIDSYQLNEFMMVKLRQAGVLDTEGAADYRMVWNVDEYFGSPKRSTIKLAIVVQEAGLDGAQWVGQVDYVWKPQVAAIDDRSADGLTYLVISRFSAGMGELGKAGTALLAP